MFDDGRRTHNYSPHELIAGAEGGRFVIAAWMKLRAGDREIRARVCTWNLEVPIIYNLHARSRWINEPVSISLVRMRNLSSSGVGMVWCFEIIMRNMRVREYVEMVDSSFLELRNFLSIIPYIFV